MLSLGRYSGRRPAPEGSPQNLAYYLNAEADQLTEGIQALLIALSIDQGGERNSMTRDTI